MISVLRTNFYLLGSCLGLLLGAAGCGAVSRPVLAGPPLAYVSAPVLISPLAPVPSPPPVVPVDALIRALLDTTAVGAHATDTRRNLQAGADNNLELYDGRSRPRNPWRIDWDPVTEQNFVHTICQSSCYDNSLVIIVLRFSNAYSVYLHDTPQRRLLARPSRAFSHGCIRLENPRELAAYLLRREGPRKSPPRPVTARQTGPQNVTFARPMAIYIRYATCTAGRGRVRFLPDIYQRDEGLRQALFGTLP